MRLPGGLSVRAIVVGILGLAIALIFVLPFVAPTPYTWISSRTPATNDVIDLYWAMFWIAVVILVIVEGGIIASVILFRQRPGHEARAFHGNTLLEFTWTIIPAVIVLALSAYSFKSLSTLTNTNDAALTIEVTGRQWQWSFTYPDGTQVVREAHIPTNTKVRFNITSVDVIHSFWIPKLSGKMDAVPGKVASIWVEAPDAGKFFGNCTEFCGLGHADMIAYLVAEPQDQFAAWLEQTKRSQQAPSGGDQVALGKQVATTTCLACHSFTAGTPSTLPQAPNLAKYGSDGPFNDQLKALKASGDADWLKKWVANAPSIKPGIAMPKWEGVLTPAQIDAVVAYLLSLK